MVSRRTVVAGYRNWSFVCITIRDRPVLNKGVNVISEVHELYFRMKWNSQKTVQCTVQYCCWWSSTAHKEEVAIVENFWRKNSWAGVRTADLWKTSQMLLPLLHGVLVKWLNSLSEWNWILKNSSLWYCCWWSSTAHKEEVAIFENVRNPNRNPNRSLWYCCWWSSTAHKEEVAIVENGKNLNGLRFNVILLKLNWPILF